MANYEIFDNATELEQQFTDYICELADKSIEEKGAFLIGLSGGSLASFLGRLKMPERAQMAKWHVFLVDERAVPLDHADSNYRAIRESFVASQACNWYPALFNGDLEQCAVNYEGKITRVFKGFSTDCFDLLLLGLGPDGHTASLFPNHPDYLKGLESSRLVIPVDNSPKPPKMRISLSPKAIKEAKAVAFVITASESKAPIIKSILQDRDPQYPPTIVAENARWFLDKASASRLLQ